jgi:hypothetical protein
MCVGASQVTPVPHMTLGPGGPESTAPASLPVLASDPGIIIMPAASGIAVAIVPSAATSASEGSVPASLGVPLKSDVVQPTAKLAIKASSARPLMLLNIHQAAARS